MVGCCILKVMSENSPLTSWGRNPTPPISTDVSDARTS
jgi:hypothetical protein